MKHLLLLCVLFIGRAGWSQSYWETLNAPPGGAPETITETSNGWIYSEFYDHSVFCSKDQGENWEQVFRPSANPDAGFQKITVGRQGRLFAERKLAPPVDWTEPQYYNVYSSVDNGAHWQLLLDSTTLHGINQNWQGTLFGIQELGSYLSNILRSDDGGANWTFLIDIFQTLDYQIEVDIYGHLIATMPNTPDYTWYSLDNGQHWNARQSFLSGEQVVFTQKGTMLVTRFNQLLRMEIDSSSYETISVDSIVPPDDYPAVYSMMVMANGDVIFNTPRHLIRSTDDGRSWTVLPPNKRIYLLIGPGSMLNGDIFCNRTGETMYQSKDLGQNWMFSGKGIPRGDIDFLYLQSDSCWLSLSDPGLWKTTDQGQNWQLLKAVQNPSIEQSTGGEMAWNRAGNIALRMDDTLFYSVNQGADWALLPMPELHPRIFALGMHDTQPIIFLNSGGGMTRTEDQGQNWQIVADSLYLDEMHTHPDGSLYAILMREIKTPNGQNGYTRPTALYRSSDQGLSWEMILDKRVQSMVINASGDLFVTANYSETYRSADGGITWVSLPFRGSNLYCNSAGQLVAHDNNKTVFLSNNNGQDWTELPKVLNLNLFSHYASAFDSRNRFYTSVWEYPGQHHFFRSAKPTSNGVFLSGTVYKDTDKDCNTLEDSLTSAGWILKAEGADTWWSSTDSMGRYNMFLDTGSYFLTVQPSVSLFWKTCADSVPVLLPELQDTVIQDMRVKALTDCPFITADVAAPWLERCFESYVYVHYCNVGTAVADSSWIDVHLDPYLIFTDTLHPIPHTWIDSSTLRFYLGALPEGYCDAFNFKVFVECDSTVLGQAVCLSAHAYPDSLCFDTQNWSGAEIRIVAECQLDTAIAFHITNTGHVATQALQYYVIEDDVVMLHGAEIYEPGETQTFSWPANGRYRRFESQQEPGHPFSKLVGAGLEGCGGFFSLGFPNWYFLNNGNPSESNYCGQIVGAFDPNDKQGFPLGYGDDHFILPNTPIHYLIRFQNTGTAPAHRVVVLDTLSELLDPSTLRMGTSSHPFSWELKGKGILAFTFDNINLPDSNSNEAASHGFVQFHIDQQRDLPDGAQIDNKASIYFDFNASIRTNQTRHRVGRKFMELLSATTPWRQTLPLRISPNPAAAGAILQFTGLEAGAYRFLLNDLTGKTVFEHPFDGQTLAWAPEAGLNGVYFFRIVDQKGRDAGSGKLMLR